MKLEDYYNDYLLIKKMNPLNPARGDMITKLLCRHPDRWRVVGITMNALKVFNENNFKKTKLPVKINRAHLRDLFQTYQEMLLKDFKDCDDWWKL